MILDLWILFFFPWFFFFTKDHHFLSFIGTKDYDFLSFFHWNITMLLSLIRISEIGICYYWEIYLLLYICMLFIFIFYLWLRLWIIIEIPMCKFGNSNFTLILELQANRVQSWILLLFQMFSTVPLVCVSESANLNMLLYLDRSTRLLAPNLNMLQDQRISIVSNWRNKYGDSFKWTLFI